MNPVCDTLVFDICATGNALRTLKPTKRNVVGFFYDPLGFLSTAIISLKINFQELCKAKIEWDEPLTSKLLCYWNRVVSNFQGVVITFPSCFFQLVQQNSVLYGFCDSSKSAYAAVIFLCSVSGLV